MNKSFEPIGNGEVLQLQLMFQLLHSLKDDESLKERMTGLKVWWRYRGLMKQLESIYGDICTTIEPERLRRINITWSHQELHIVTAGQPVDPHGDMMMVPRQAILHLGQHCQQEACTICLATNEDRRKCLFRQAMKEMTIPDLRRMEKKTGKCMGQIYSWGKG